MIINFYKNKFVEILIYKIDGHMTKIIKKRKNATSLYYWIILKQRHQHKRNSINSSIIFFVLKIQLLFINYLFVSTF